MWPKGTKTEFGETPTFGEGEGVIAELTDICTVGLKDFVRLSVGLVDDQVEGDCVRKLLSLPDC